MEGVVWEAEKEQLVREKGQLEAAVQEAQENCSTLLSESLSLKTTVGTLESKLEGYETALAQAHLETEAALAAMKALKVKGEIVDTSSSSSSAVHAMVLRLDAAVAQAGMYKSESEALKDTVARLKGDLVVLKGRRREDEKATEEALQSAVMAATLVQAETLGKARERVQELEREVAKWRAACESAEASRAALESSLGGVGGVAKRSSPSTSSVRRSPSYHLKEEQQDQKYTPSNATLSASGVYLPSTPLSPGRQQQQSQYSPFTATSLDGAHQQHSHTSAVLMGRALRAEQLLAATESAVQVYSLQALESQVKAEEAEAAAASYLKEKDALQRELVAVKKEGEANFARAMKAAEEQLAAATAAAAAAAATVVQAPQHPPPNPTRSALTLLSSNPTPPPPVVPVAIKPSPLFPTPTLASLPPPPPPPAVTYPMDAVHSQLEMARRVLALASKDLLAVAESATSVEPLLYSLPPTILIYITYILHHLHQH